MARMHVPITVVETFDLQTWEPAPTAAERERALSGLEHGHLLLFPRLAFGLSATERAFLDPAVSDGKAKNVSLDVATGRLQGTSLGGDDVGALRAMVTRFANAARGLMNTLFPDYSSALQWGRTSFRPCEVDNRPSSYRQDDRRLHVDAFPSRPNGGRRILRVFTNVNPDGRPRVWRVGEPFADFAQRFWPRLAAPVPGVAWLLRRLGVTKGWRTPYDHYMLQLHDKAKGDTRYQREAPQQELILPAGSTWIVCTDQVLHAASSGQHMLEQTFYLDVAQMRAPDLSPLRALERLSGRRLVG